MGAQEVGISAWALATLKPKGWRKMVRCLLRRAAEEEVLDDLNWWSAAHLEYAARVASKRKFGSLYLPRQEPEDRKEFLSSLTALCAEEVAQIRADSKQFQEKPLKVAAELQPWKDMEPGASVLIFGAGRHIRPALQMAGFETTIWRRFASGSCGAKEWPEAAEKERFKAAAMRYPDSSESFEFALHAVATSLEEGAPLWVYGDVREGVLSTTRSIRGLFSLSAIHEDGDCRVISAIRTRRKAQDEFESWLRIESIDFGYGFQDWWSVPGLFAAGKVDVMSQYLLDTMLHVRNKIAASDGTWHLLDCKPCHVMDFASGTGVLAAGASKLLEVGRCLLLDADACALQAAGRNLPEASRILADGFRCDLPEEKFHLIISNPPVICRVR
jgi:16S rRNA G1207 methylase RsmC